MCKKWTENDKIKNKQKTKELFKRLKATKFFTRSSSKYIIQ